MVVNVFLLGQLKHAAYVRFGWWSLAVTGKSAADVERLCLCAAIAATAAAISVVAAKEFPSPPFLMYGIMVYHDPRVPLSSPPQKHPYC